MKTDHMGRKSFEKAGGLSPERIRQMDADIAQALSSERETGGVDVPSLKLLDAIDAKIRRRNRRSVAGAFAAVCLPLVALCLTAFAELYGWGHEPVMRSVQVPAGEHLRVLLADGSAVTLNACSELRYPERFARRRREVRLVRGEAFFEVAHDASAPFTVETDDVSVEVLGTKFNVNAYDKEVTTVYLKEGKVRLTERVTGRQNRYLMAPDEMLAVDRNARTCRAAGREVGSRSMAAQQLRLHERAVGGCRGVPRTALCRRDRGGRRAHSPIQLHDGVLQRDDRRGAFGDVADHADPLFACQRPDYRPSRPMIYTRLNR